MVKHKTKKTTKEVIKETKTRKQFKSLSNITNSAGYIYLGEGNDWGSSPQIFYDTPCVYREYDWKKKEIVREPKPTNELPAHLRVKYLPLAIPVADQITNIVETQCSTPALHRCEAYPDVTNIQKVGSPNKMASWSYKMSAVEMYHPLHEMDAIEVDSTWFKLPLPRTHDFEDNKLKRSYSATNMKSCVFEEVSHSEPDSESFSLSDSQEQSTSDQTLEFPWGPKKTKLSSTELSEETLLGFGSLACHIGHVTEKLKESLTEVTAGGDGRLKEDGPEALKHLRSILEKVHTSVMLSELNNLYSLKYPWDKRMFRSPLTGSLVGYQRSCHLVHVATRVSTLLYPFETFLSEIKSSVSFVALRKGKLVDWQVCLADLGLEDPNYEPIRITTPPLRQLQSSLKFGPRAVSTESLAHRIFTDLGTLATLTGVEKDFLYKFLHCKTRGCRRKLILKVKTPISIESEIKKLCNIGTLLTCLRESTPLFHNSFGLESSRFVEWNSEGLDELRSCTREEIDAIRQYVGTVTGSDEASRVVSNSFLASKVKEYFRNLLLSESVSKNPLRMKEETRAKIYSLTQTPWIISVVITISAVLAIRIVDIYKSFDF